jgi:hypothetical protein
LGSAKNDEHVCGALFKSKVERLVFSHSTDDRHRQVAAPKSGYENYQYPR